MWNSTKKGEFRADVIAYSDFCCSILKVVTNYSDEVIWNRGVSEFITESVMPYLIKGFTYVSEYYVYFVLVCYGFCYKFVQKCCCSMGSSIFAETVLPGIVKVIVIEMGYKAVVDNSLKEFARDTKA